MASRNTGKRVTRDRDAARVVLYDGETKEVARVDVPRSIGVAVARATRRTRRRLRAPGGLPDIANLSLTDEVPRLYRLPARDIFLMPDVASLSLAGDEPSIPALPDMSSLSLADRKTELDDLLMEFQRMGLIDGPDSPERVAAVVPLGAARMDVAEEALPVARQSHDTANKKLYSDVIAAVMRSLPVQYVVGALRAISKAWRSASK